MKRTEIKVYGQVQGVFFRQGVKEMAEELDLTGWASNEVDGSVKIVAEGSEENLQKLIEWCKKGTDWSKIKEIKIERQEASSEFSSFAVRS